jgi:L,D-transpeptidase catalytic domain
MPKPNDDMLAILGEVHRLIAENNALLQRFVTAEFERMRLAVAQNRANDVGVLRSDNQEEVILLELAEREGLSLPMQRLINYRNEERPNSHPRYWAVVNFDLHSKYPRLFLFDLIERSVKGYLCAHGKGSEGTHDDGMADEFSNVDGSKASSLGIYVCAETYFGDNGYSMRLDGMESSNSRARHRAIVVHGAPYVSQATIDDSGRIGRSWGCPAVEIPHTNYLIDALKNGSLLMIWSSELA